MFLILPGSNAFASVIRIIIQMDILTSDERIICLSFTHSANGHRSDFILPVNKNIQKFIHRIRPQSYVVV